MNFLKKILNSQKVEKIELTITSTNGFHLRPIAKFANEAKKFKSKIVVVTKKGEALASDMSKILSLSLNSGDKFILKANGEDSKLAISHLSSFFNRLMADDKEIPKSSTKGSSIEPISKGVAVGRLFECEYEEIIENSSVDINSAISLVDRDLSDRFNRSKSEDNSQIFLAQRELLGSLVPEEGFKSLDEFKETIADKISSIENSSFASKILDYKDLEQRVLYHLGIKRVLSTPKEESILIAEDILPQDVDIIENSLIKGVILKHGSLTSHSSILLRSLNIPSIILNRDLDIEDKNREIILDSIKGELILSPTPEELSQAKLKEERLKMEKESSFKSRFEIVKTRFGKKIKILANVIDVTSAKEAKEFGADGIGLLRTEFLFKEKKPTLDEQIDAYREIFEIFDDITVRTLDIGGDKSLPYISIPKEDNPFLGLRGIRFSLYEKELFREQLLAIFKAHNQKPIKIMFPMVSQKEEFIEAKKIALDVAKEHKIDIDNIQFGIMLEVPSVILAIKIFDREVDFYSIGTNDLTQYLFAVERTHNILKINPLSPILISALKIIIDTTKKPVSICGELAGIDEAIGTLIGIGYDRLSVSPKLIPHVKSRVRSL